MSYLNHLAAVNRQSIDDIEFGCVIYSESTLGPSGYQIGGVVVDIHEAEDGFKQFFVLRWGPEPYTQPIPQDDVRLFATEFTSTQAGKESEQLSKYAGRKKITQDERIQWLNLAVRLAEVNASAAWTPRAEARYREALRSNIEARKGAEGADHG